MAARKKAATRADAARVEVSEDQVRSFRAQRNHLTGAGAPDLRSAAATILGAQAQQLYPALLGLSMRTKGRPTAAAVQAQLTDAPRSLVRTWGQRDTLFVYAPDDWPLVVAARRHWAQSGRAGPTPTAAAVAKALAKVQALDRPAMRSDLLGIAPKSFVDALRERAEEAKMDVQRLAAGRLIQRLAWLGETSIADIGGRERSYAARADWFGDLEWTAPSDPEPSAATEAAARALALRYFAVHGPATAQDVGHFFGARQSEVRQWLADLAPALTPVRCGDREGLLARSADVDLLRKPAPGTATAWPLRLLPQWESLLMAHADKSWTVPIESERKQIWRKAAVVAPVVFARGQAVATWSMKRTKTRLDITVEPLSSWRKSHAAAVKREALAVAAHYEIEKERTEVTLP